MSSFKSYSRREAEDQHAALAPGRPGKCGHETGSGQPLQAFLVKHLAGRTQAFHGLWHPAIDADHMNNGAQFFL